MKKLFFLLAILTSFVLNAQVSTVQSTKYIPRESPPTGAVEGQVYYDTDGYLYQYTGSEWKPLINKTIAKRHDMIYAEPNNGAEIVSYFNSNQSITIEPGETYYFYVFSGIPNPLISKVAIYIVSNVDPGVYGQGGTPLINTNLLLLDYRVPTIDDIQESSNTQFIELGDIGSNTIEVGLNIFSPCQDIQDQNEGYTIVTATIDGTDYEYLWIGSTGEYGSGCTDTAIEDDFQLLDGGGISGASTGLEAIDEGNGVGWRLIGRNPNNYGDIGLNSVDLSTSLAPSSIAGATGSRSFTIGFNTRASGVSSFASGISSVASGQYSTALGANTKAEAYYSTAIGAYNIGGGDPLSAVGTDPLFEVGNGSLGSPSNALTILKNGHIRGPSYGSGSITGTATYNLAVDTDGNVIETVLGAGGDYIPLSGTEVGSPVTGDIEFNSSVLNSSIFNGITNYQNENDEFNSLGFRATQTDKEGFIGVINDDDDDVIPYFSYVDGNIKRFFRPDSWGYDDGTDTVEIYLDTNGLSGVEYYGANYDDNTYVQRKYVTDNFLPLPTEGTNGQVLTTDGAGTYTWENASGSGSGIENIVEDTTPQLGGNLDLNGNSITSISPIETPDTGAVISLSTIGGNNCNLGSANATTSYSIAASPVLNGYARVLINAASEPTITGATKEGGVPFEADTNMYMFVWNKGAEGVVYYFLPVTESSASSSTQVNYQTEITATSTIFDGSQKGLNNIYVFNSSSNQTVRIDAGDYVENDVINIERRGQGTLEVVQGTDVRFRGVRDIENRFFINDANSTVSLYCRGNDEFTIIGNLKRGYTGPVTTSSYSPIQSSETIDVEVAGTGFSDNMLVTLTGNATLNSFTANSETSATLNITSSGSDGDYLTVTYDNGDIYEDIDCIQLTDTAPLAIVLETTSTSAGWSPTNVINSGATLRWTVSGDASGVYDANDPTIDLSGNVGTAIITITSADDLAGLTRCRFTSLAITSADVSNWTACEELWFFGNSSLGSDLTGEENLTNLTSIDCRGNGLTSFSGTFPLVTNTVKLNQNAFTTFDASGFPNATGMDLWGMSTITSVDVSSNTSLTSLTLSGNANMTTITGLSNLTNLTSITIANSTAMTSIDIGSNTLLTNVVLTNCSLTQSVVNNVILDLDAHGLSNITLNYSLNANPSATENTTNDVLDSYNNLIGKSATITGAVPAD